MSLYNDASLVMIPSAYKDGKLYSIKPTDGSGDFTFSRGSNLAATRVDENGLIEKGRENLFLRSNTFNTSPWFVTGIDTPTSGQSGYDGSSDAWILEKNGAYAYLYQEKSISGVQTFSFYGKAGTLPQVRITINTSGPNVTAAFDLANGIDLGGSQNITSSIQSVGNGWYRCSVTYNQGTTSRFRIYPADVGGDLTGTSGSIYIQDAQLEVGLVATDYIETTTTTAQAGILEDMPRLDYSGSCPSLLLEPQRTNLVTYSEYFNASSWQKLASGTASIPVVTSNQGVSPEGLNNASKVVFNRGAGTTSSDFSRLYFSSGSAPASASIYVKSFDGTEYDMYLVCGNAFNAISVTNQWQRFDVTELTTGSNIQLRLQGNLGAESTAEVLVYGAMLESGGYSSSYIPTYGSQVTRSADTCFNNTDDFAGTDQVTLFAELDNNGNDRIGSFFRFNLNQGTSTAEWIFLGYESINSVRFYVRSNSSTSVDISAGSYGAGVLKMAAKIDSEGNYKVFANGVQISSGSNAVFSSLLNRVNIGQTNGSTAMEDRVKQLIVFPTALTDSECIALTS